MNDVLVLPAELTVRSGMQLRQALLAAIDRPQPDPLMLDASQVEEVDGAGVQLLIALRRSLAARRRGLALLGSTPALESALSRFGFAVPKVQGAAE